LLSLLKRTAGRERIKTEVLREFDDHSADLFDHAFAVFDVSAQQVISRTTNWIGLRASTTFSWWAGRSP
jgi:hypothetical protein